MARRGADVVGIDNSMDQLKTAQRLMREHGISLSLIHGNAEAAPYPNDAGHTVVVLEDMPEGGGFVETEDGRLIPVNSINSCVKR